MAKEGERGFIKDTLKKSEILDWAGIGAGILIGSVGLVILSTGLLIAKKEGVKRLEKKR